MGRRGLRLTAIFATVLILGATACRRPESPSAAARHLVLYAAVNREVAEPIIAAFEKKTGVKVDVVFDSEAAKTVGLAKRLELEKAAPRADVWWSGETLYTALLAEKGVLAPLPAGLPAPPLADGPYWVTPGFRLRVMVYRPSAFPSTIVPPRRTLDLLRPEFKSQIALARTNVGTTAMWMIMIAKEASGREFLERLAAHKPLWVAGNAMAVEAVMRDQSLVGITDIDDAIAARERDATLEIMPLDDPGFPRSRYLTKLSSSAAVVNGSSAPEAARSFLSFLMDAEAQKIITSVGNAWPSNESVAPSPRLPKLFDAAVGVHSDSAEAFSGHGGLVGYPGSRLIENYRESREFLDRTFQER